MADDFLNDDEKSDDEEGSDEIYNNILKEEKHIDLVYGQFQELAQKRCKELQELGLSNHKIAADSTNTFEAGMYQEIHLSSTEPDEQRGLFDLLRISDGPYAKILAALMQLLRLVNEYTANIQEKVYEPLLIFGEEKEFLSFDIVDANKEFHVTKIVGLLNDIHTTIKVLNVLLQHLVTQMHNLYNKNLREFQQVFKKILLVDIFDAIGTILRVFINIDMIVSSNEQLTSAWTGFKRILFAVKSDLPKYNINERQLRRMERLVKRFDQGVMGTELFKKTVSRELLVESTTQEKTLKFNQNPDFIEAFSAYIMYKIRYLDAILGSEQELNERLDVITLYCNYILFLKTCKKFDPNQYKLLWKLQMKAPVIPIVGHVTFKSEAFLKLYIEQQDKGIKLEPKDMRQYRLDYFKLIKAKYEERIDYFSLKTVDWTTTLNSPLFLEKTEAKSPTDDIYYMTTVLCTGLNIAAQIKIMTDDLWLLTYNEHIEPPQELLFSVMKAITLIKGIDCEISRKSRVISTFMPLMKRVLLLQLGIAWRASLSNIENNPKSDFRDFLRLVFRIGIQTAQTSLSPIRYRFIKLLRTVLCSKEYMKPEHAGLVDRYYNRLLAIQEWDKLLLKTTRFDYFYKIRAQASYFFEIISAHKQCAKMLRYIFQIFEDPSRLLNRMNYLEDKSKVFEKYKQEFLNALEGAVIKPVVSEITELLLLKIHSFYITSMKQENPLDGKHRDPTPLIHTPPFFLFGERINIKEIIENRLTKNFYDAEALKAIDWQTYEDIKCLAFHLYGLEIEESLLPPQKKEQGTDIISVLKRLPEFTQKYHFSLHTQVFFEITDETKRSINVFGVTQAANSFHTHGTGIRNTVLNQVRKFIASKIDLLNKILYLDFENLSSNSSPISSQLFAEEKFWTDNKDRLALKYPIERAQDLNQKLSDFGRTPDGQTLLSKFRRLITNIGNALGFIAVAKSAFKRYCYDIQQYAIDKKELKCEQLTRDCQQSAEACAAAVLVDDLVAKDMTTQKVTDFKIFFSLFTEENLKSEEMKHFEQFYMIIPALTINFVEAFMKSKNTMMMKTNANVYFCDDGFAVGIAFLLKLLRQQEKFSSLNWFESAIAKYDSVKTSKEGAGGAENASTKRSAGSYQKEFEWLFYSFVAAQQLFKEE